MKVDLKCAGDLSASEWETWSCLQKSNACFDSAFYAPQYTQAVHHVRGDVEVGILCGAGERTGFLPFHRNRWNMGSPVGKHLTDFQGAIVAEDATWDAAALISGCGLRSWHFNHLPIWQEPFQAFRRGVEESPYIDLANGYEAYERERRESGSSLFSQVHRKSRKIEREVGPLRFAWQTTDRKVFEALLSWKREQRMRSGMSNPFPPWAIELLEHLRTVQGEDFAGLLSALYVGGELAAAHLGLRSEAVFHVWFPAYNRAVAKYSPGLILLLALARECASRGIRRIDLGKGDERYKTSTQTDSLSVAEGWVGVGVTARLFPGAWYQARRRLRTEPLRGPYTYAKRTVRGLYRRAADLVPQRTAGR